MLYWDQIYRQQNQIPECKGGSLYTVQRGETLDSIARKYNIHLEQILKTNPHISNPALIFPGQIICLPVVTGQVDFCQINMQLSPLAIEKGIVGAVAYLNKESGECYIAGFNMPSPYRINRQYCSYKAWVADYQSEDYVKIDLIRTIDGIYVGHKRGKCSLTNFDQVIITAEKRPNTKVPLGSVLAIGNVTCCY